MPPRLRSRHVDRGAVRRGPGIQFGDWQHSYVAGEKTFCIYLAESEEVIREHAELSGFPVSAVTESPWKFVSSRPHQNFIPEIEISPSGAPQLVAPG